MLTFGADERGLRDGDGLGGVCSPFPEDGGAGGGELAVGGVGGVSGAVGRGGRGATQDAAHRVLETIQ